MKSRVKLVFFLLILPFMALWLWAVSLPYFEFTRFEDVNQSKRMHWEFWDFSHNRYTPDLLRNIDEGRAAGLISRQEAKTLREEIYLNRVVSRNASATNWRQLANFYYAYREQEAASKAMRNAERVTGIYLPSMRNMLQQYLIYQDKEGAARVLNKILVMHYFDLKPIFEPFMKIYTPAEMLKDVLPYHLDEENIEIRVHWLHTALHRASKLPDPEVFIQFIEEIIAIEPRPVLRQWLSPVIVKDLIARKQFDLLTRVLEKVGYSGAYPKVDVVSYDALDNSFYCNYAEQNPSGVKLEKTSEKLALLVDAYDKQYVGDLFCIIPIVDNTTDIVEIAWQWRGKLADEDNEHVAVSSRLSLIKDGEPMVFGAQKNGQFSNKEVHSMTLDRDARFLLAEFKVEAKSTVYAPDPVEFELQSVEIKSKLNGL